MAKIRPFRAWRYNEAKIRDINKKFSPLFDVVSPEQLEQLYNIPNNSIHLSVPRSHDEVLGKLKEWKEVGIIKQDPEPGIYVYYQEFSLFGDSRRYVRKGFISMIGLTGDPGKNEGDIVLHEGTISHSVEDRTRLLEKTLLNVAPTHGLYDDPDLVLEQIMDRYMEKPRYEYIDYQGVINKLSIIRDPKDIAPFVNLLSEKTVYLADGHHRLASSWHLLSKHKQALVPESMLPYHLMYLTNLRSDDLRILAIHRVLSLDQAPGRLNAFLYRFQPWFRIWDITNSRAPVYEELRNRKHAFGMVTGKRTYLIELRPELDPREIIELDLPDPVKELDYTLLHYLVFDRIFGIPYHEQGGSKNIAYVKHYSTAVKTPVGDENKISFITPELSMDQMMKVCAVGALMPQKSTYFYPKVVCGLVFASISDDENNISPDPGLGLSPQA